MRKKKGRRKKRRGGTAAAAAAKIYMILQGHIHTKFKTTGPVLKSVSLAPKIGPGI